MDPVGRDSEHALKMLNKKRLELAYVAAGGEVKEGEATPDKDPDQNGNRKKMSIAIAEYLADCEDREGKSGYGLASRTPETYEYRLGFLTEFEPEAYLDEIDDTFLKKFRRFLRKHKKDLGDRTCYNIVQAVSTFLLRNRSEEHTSELQSLRHL